MADLELLAVGRSYDLIVEFNAFVRLDGCKYQGGRRDGLHAFIVPAQKGMEDKEFLSVSSSRISAITVPGGTLMGILDQGGSPDEQ